MRAEVLSKYLKKAKQFAWEKGPGSIYSNVAMLGNNDTLTLSCSDGNAGIKQSIDQPTNGEHKLIIECCVNIFKLSKVIDTIDGKTDLKFEQQKSKLRIKSKSIDTSFETFSISDSINVFECKEWNVLNKDFINELNSVMPAMDELDAPIVYRNGILFLQNPKALYYTLTDKCDKDFSIDQKYIRKLQCDNFENIFITDSNVHLKNDKCRIYVPTFNGNTINLKPLIKNVNEYDIKCKVNIKEIKYLYGIIKELAEVYETYDKKIRISLNEDRFKINFYDSEFLVNDYIYTKHNIFNFSIPISHIKAIIKDTFTRKEEYAHIKLASENYRGFVIENNGVTFVGGLWREQQ